MNRDRDNGLHDIVVQLAGRPGLDLPPRRVRLTPFTGRCLATRPLRWSPVPELAAELGVGRLLVKDESSRLGLPAFKVLGASWASRQVLQRHPGAMLVPPPTATTAARSPGWRPISVSGRPCSSRW